MIPQRPSPEVYAREINEPNTLALYLHGRMYGCKYEQGSRLPEARYFAPHFGMQIAKIHPGINVGISYIARIEAIEVVATWGDLRQAVVNIRGKAWWNGHDDIVNRIKDWGWDGSERRYMLFLGQPRLAFNPPVLKERLQKGKGWLSRRFLSFDELFGAWGC